MVAMGQSFECVRFPWIDATICRQCTEGVTFLLPGPSNCSIMQNNMRKFIITFLTLAFVTFGSTSVFAAKYKDNSKDNSIAGTISAFDTGSQTITIKGAKGDTKVVVDSSTLITVNGKAGAVSDIKPGVQAVVGVFTFGDKLTAISVKIGTTQVSEADAATKKKKKKDAN